MSRAYHAIAHHRGLTLGLIAGLFAAIAVVGILGYDCPRGAAKKEVVAKQGSNPSQQPGPSGDGLNGSTSNPPSSPNVSTPPPKEPNVPQPSPPDPSPPSPPPPVSSNPPGVSVTAPGLGASVKPTGTCVNALGIAVSVGSC